MNSLVTIPTKEVRVAGKFVIPGVCQIKTRTKPATKLGKRVVLARRFIFGFKVKKGK